MKQLIILLALLSVVCTVKYPSDCIIENTKFESGDHFKAQVECSYLTPADGRSLYFANISRSSKQNKPSRVDYLPDDTLTDTITLTCQ